MAWLNSPSLENECTILKNWFFFFGETNDEDDDFLKNGQDMAKCPSLTINVNFWEILCIITFWNEEWA